MEYKNGKNDVQSSWSSTRWEMGENTRPLPACVWNGRSIPNHNNDGGGNQEVKIIDEPIIWDGYNQRIRQEKGIVGTLTRNCGGDLKRNGQGVIEIREATKQGYAIAEEGDSINLEQPNSTTPRGRVGKGVAQTITTQPEQATIEDFRIRKLTPKECFRLMDFDDEDVDKCVAAGISNSQLYKQAGNSIVVACLEEIFRQLL